MCGFWNRRRVAWLFVLVVLAGITLLSAQPHSAAFTEKTFGPYNTVARKVAHSGEFALLTFALVFAMRRLRSHCHWLLTSILSAGLAIGYAFVDEWHQSYVPGRTPSLHDVAVDCTGVGSAFLLICLYYLLFSRRR